MTLDNLNTVIDARETDVLVNKYGLFLTDVEKTTVGELTVSWLSILCRNNAIIYKDNTFPTSVGDVVLSHYYSGTGNQWVDITPDQSISTAMVAQHSPWGAYVIKSDYPTGAVYGLSCTYGTVDVGIIDYSTASPRNGILTIDANGNITECSILPVAPINNNFVLCDMARVGFEMYSIYSSTTKIYRTVSSWNSLDNNTLTAEEVPGFDGADFFNVDAVKGTILNASMSVVGKYIYMVIRFVEDTLLVRYDITTQTAEKLSDTLGITASEAVQGTITILYHV